MSHSAPPRRCIFPYHMEHQMVQIPHGCILHSKIFPTTPHMPKFEFKRTSYVINKLEKKTSPLTDFFTTKSDFVATKPMTKLSCYKTKFVITELATNSVMIKPDFVATKPVTKLSCDKTRFCHNIVSNKLCRDKPRFCRDKA